MKPVLAEFCGEKKVVGSTEKERDRKTKRKL